MCPPSLDWFTNWPSTREPRMSALSATTNCALALFGVRPALFGHVAVVAGQVVGCALWFLNFSTWRGVHGIYLEDLYVQPEHRGQGVGRALLRELAAECGRRGYVRLEWSVLDWNEPAIRFYRSQGAELQEEWRIFRLSDEGLAALAQVNNVS